MEERKRIEDDAWRTIDELKERNRDEQDDIVFKACKAKADLQKEVGAFKSSNDDKRKLTTEITEKISASRTHEQNIAELKNQIEAQKSELRQRRNTIEEKDS